MRIAVVGAGVVGLSATACLLERGADAVCFERSTVAMGERSAGSTRIFRLAHTAPELVRLAAEARAGFARWQRAADVPMVDDSGCVITGTDVAERAAAMAAAGAAHHVVETTGDLLPAATPLSPALVDPAGGVIDVDAVRAFLVARTREAVVHDPVYALESDGSGATVRTRGGSARFDAVVIAAGAGTSPLAAQVGIYTPPALDHHVRFTFPIDDSRRWPAWIDNPPAGMGTYQHRSGPGRWSVGGHVDPAQTAWEVGPEAAAAALEEAVLRYARERLTVEPTIVERLYCTSVPNLGDGVHFRRSGAVLAIHGENLMKFAPVLGEALAAAALDGSTPAVAELISG
jgi:sarcosine oxidase